MSVDPQSERFVGVPKKSGKLFWIDAIGNLSRSEEVTARMQGKDGHLGSTLYVLPTTLPVIVRIERFPAVSAKYKAIALRLNYRHHNGADYLGKVDLSVALSAFWSTETSATIRALAHPYDFTREVDILVIEPACLAYTQAAVN